MFLNLNCRSFLENFCIYTYTSGKLVVVFVLCLYSELLSMLISVFVFFSSCCDKMLRQRQLREERVYSGLVYSGYSLSLNHKGRPGDRALQRWSQAGEKSNKSRLLFSYLLTHCGPGFQPGNGATHIGQVSPAQLTQHSLISTPRGPLLRQVWIPPSWQLTPNISV